MIDTTTTPKKCNCPNCNKELINLNLMNTNILKFRCDDCDIEMTIKTSKKK